MKLAIGILLITKNAIAILATMNKRPKIWHSEDQIIAAIDRTRRMATRSLERSKELDEKAREKFGWCEKLRFELMKPNLTEMQREDLESKIRSAEHSAGATKEKADLAAKQYHRAINSTLPRLGEILAAFRTQPMEAIVGDYKSVCVK